MSLNFDMVDVIEFCDPYLFADDTKLSKGIFNDDDCKEVQMDIHNMYSWSEDSQLRFHLGKLAAMRIALGIKDPPS